MTDRANEVALRGADLRVTRPRLAVMAALERRPHAETSTIIELVREQHSDVSHQAVYDVLAALTVRRAGAPDPAAGLGGALRGARRRQPSPCGVPPLRRGRRRRLRSGRRAVPRPARRPRVRDRRGGGHLLGRLPRVPGVRAPDRGAGVRPNQEPERSPVSDVADNRDAVVGEMNDPSAPERVRWPIAASPIRCRATPTRSGGPIAST